jgi:hypothetical protein
MQLCSDEEFEENTTKRGKAKEGGKKEKEGAKRGTEKGENGNTTKGGDDQQDCEQVGIPLGDSDL